MRTICWLIATVLCGTCVASAPHTSDDERGYSRPYHVEWSKSFSEGLGEVEIDGKWGFINTSGKLVIPATFDSVSPFSGGLATVRRGAILGNPKTGIVGLFGFWCWIDHQGI